MRVRTLTADLKWPVTTSNVVVAVAVADIDAGAVSASTFFKMAFAYKLNDCAADIDGGGAVVDTICAIPTDNRMRIGGDLSGDPLNERIQSITYYRTDSLTANCRVWRYGRLLFGSRHARRD